MSSAQSIECNNLRNPFIRNSYGISDDIIEKTIAPSSSSTTSPQISPEQVKQIKDFKKKILPKMYVTYKNKYNKYSTYSGTVSTIIFYSNFYRQFSSLYLNKDLNKELDNINRLIENSNQIKSNQNKSDEIIRLYETLEGAENLYFQKNNEYKIKIRDLLTFLSRDYYGLFREYYSFMYNQTLAKYNAVKQYLDKLPDSGSIDEKTYKEQYLALTKVISGEYTQSLPRVGDNRLRVLILTTPNPPNPPNPPIQDTDYIKLVKYEYELKEKTTQFKKFMENIKTEEEYYRNVLKTYNSALQSEKEEEKAFIVLQKVRMLLQKKFQELGGSLGDKKFTNLQKQFEDAYTTYNNSVKNRITKYYELLNLQNENSTIYRTSKINNNDQSNFELNRFKISYLLRYLFSSSNIISGGENINTMEDLYQEIKKNNYQIKGKTYDNFKNDFANKIEINKYIKDYIKDEEIYNFFIFSLQNMRSKNNFSDFNKSFQIALKSRFQNKFTQNIPDLQTKKYSYDFKNLFNYFRKVEENNGIDENNIEMKKIKGLSYINKFIIQIENQTQNEMEILKNQLELLKLESKDASDEYSIVKGQKNSANQNKESKKEEIKSLKDERDELDKQEKAELKELQSQENLVKSNYGKLGLNKIEPNPKDFKSNVFNIIHDYNGIEDDEKTIYCMTKEDKMNPFKLDDIRVKIFDNSVGILDNLMPTYSTTQNDIKNNVINLIEKIKVDFETFRIDINDNTDIKYIITTLDDFIIKNGDLEYNGNKVFVSPLPSIPSPTPFETLTTLIKYIKTNFEKDFSIQNSLISKILKTRINIYFKGTGGANNKTKLAALTTFRTDFNNIMKTLDTIDKQKENHEKIKNKLDEVKERIKLIEQGPRNITEMASSRKVYSERFTGLMTTLNDLITKKDTLNKQIISLVKPFEQNVEDIFTTLLQRESIRTKINKKNNIQSTIYDLYSNDPLYKIIKTFNDFINDGSNPPISPDIGINVMKSIGKYINTRKELFPKIVSNNIVKEAKLESQKHTLSSIIEMTKGEKFGNLNIPSNLNTSKLINKINKENIQNVSNLMSKLSQGEISFSNIPSNKIEKYRAKYGSLIPPKLQGGANNQSVPPVLPNQSSTLPVVQPTPPPVLPNQSSTLPVLQPTPTPSVVQTNLNPLVVEKTINQKQIPVGGNMKALENKKTENKINRASLVKDNLNEFFMEYVFEVLSSQKDEKIDMFLKKLRETEETILKITSTYFDNVKSTFDGNGTDKLKDHLKVIKDMCDKCTKDFEEEISQLMKKGVTSSKMINIMMISKYIYMEVILLYIITYFVK